MEYDHVMFLENAAKESRYHAGLWFRYLRKVFEQGEIQLNNEELSIILRSPDLTMFQKVSLKQAATNGTPTQRYVADLNRRTQIPMLRTILKRHNHV